MQQRYYKITDEPINGESIIRKLTTPEIGAVVTFVGVVRESTEGQRVKHLEYEAYPEMAESVLAQIGDEISEQWQDVAGIAIVHRTGKLEIGETAVVIALSAAHRVQLFDALHYAIDRLKVIVPIWKKEVWSDGTGEWKSEL
jgi:molybdopterin synthase catalytic subunit